VTQVLSDVIWADDTPFVVPDEYAVPLGDAMTAVGDVLRATEEDHPERVAELAGSADAAVNELTTRIGSEPHPNDAPSAVESILVSLHRMLRVAKPGRPEVQQAIPPGTPPPV